MAEDKAKKHGINIGRGGDIILANLKMARYIQPD
jgi:hypothetical protein